MSRTTKINSTRSLRCAMSNDQNLSVGESARSPRRAVLQILAAAAAICSLPAFANDATTSQTMGTIVVGGAVSDPRAAPIEEFNDIDLPDLPVVMESDNDTQPQAR
jgi:hypothetical protein